jgi:hypothetical protein
MKKSLSLFLTLLSFSSFADQLDSRINERLQVIQESSNRGEISRLSQQEKKEISESLGGILGIIRADNRRPSPEPQPRPNPGGNDWRRNSSYQRNRVVGYSDDHCNAKVTEVAASDECNRLVAVFGSSRIWSVSVNGECANITDTNFASSCRDMKYLASTQQSRTDDLTAYSDDNCSAKITAIDPGVDCQALGPIYSNIRLWSVKIDNKCVNIPDTFFTSMKCQELQDGVIARYENDGRRRSGDTVELFSDDNCSAAVTTIRRGDNCSALNGIYNNQKVWSVRFRGQCVNSPDTFFQQACESYSR